VQQGSAHRHADTAPAQAKDICSRCKWGEGQRHLSAQKAANWAPSQLTASDSARVCAFASAYRSVSSRLPNKTASPGKAWLVASQYSMMPVHLKVLGSMQMSEFETRDSNLQLQAHRHCLQGSCDAYCLSVTRVMRGTQRRGEHRQRPITKTKLQLLFHRAWGRVSRVCTFGVNGHDCVMWLIVR